MDKLNKWQLDSSWKTKKSVNEQIKVIKQVNKEYGGDLKMTIKVKQEGIWHNIYVKYNRLKK